MPNRTSAFRPAPHSYCRAQLWGLRFPNPVGLAAGFDKHAEAVDPLLPTDALPPVRWHATFQVSSKVPKEFQRKILASFLPASTCDRPCANVVSVQKVNLICDCFPSEHESEHLQNKCHHFVQLPLPVRVPVATSTGFGFVEIDRPRAKEPPPLPMCGTTVWMGGESHIQQQ